MMFQSLVVALMTSSFAWPVSHANAVPGAHVGKFRRLQIPQIPEACRKLQDEFFERLPSFQFSPECTQQMEMDQEDAPVVYCNLTTRIQVAVPPDETCEILDITHEDLTAEFTTFGFDLECLNDKDLMVNAEITASIMELAVCLSNTTASAGNVKDLVVQDLELNCPGGSTGSIPMNNAEASCDETTGTDGTSSFHASNVFFSGAFVIAGVLGTM